MGTGLITSVLKRAGDQMIAGSFYVAPVASHLKHLNTLTFVRRGELAVPLFGATDRPHTPCWWGSGGDIVLDGIPLFGEPELYKALAGVIGFRLSASVK